MNASNCNTTFIKLQNSAKDLKKAQFYDTIITIKGGYYGEEKKRIT